MKISPHDLFVIMAVQGQMREADDLLRDPATKTKILREALILRMKNRAIPIHAPLYRGLLLGKHETQQKRIVAQEGTCFTSWTEDVDVALWFSDTKSLMSSFVLLQRPGLTGWVAELAEPDGAHVLFHHGWMTKELLEKARFVVPRLGSDPRQFEWNIATQSEVIMLPHAGTVEIARREDYEPASTAALDKKFWPPWVK